MTREQDNHDPAPDVPREHTWGELQRRFDQVDSHVSEASKKLDHLNERVHQVELKVAGGGTFPVWAKGMALTLLLQTAGAVWWAAQIDARVETMPQLQERLTSAFQAMRNSDSTIATIQSEHLRMRQELDGIQKRTIEGTDDRWRKRDDEARMAELHRYLDAQLASIGERITRQERRSEEMDRRWQYLTGAGLLKGYKN